MSANMTRQVGKLQPQERLNVHARHTTHTLHTTSDVKLDDLD